MLVALPLTIIFVTMGKEFEEFKWTKSWMRAHAQHTDNMVFIGTKFIGTKFPLHFIFIDNSKKVIEYQMYCYFLYDICLKYFSF
jgi:hypothetical protein